MLRRNSRADPVEIFPPELGVGVFDRGELAKDGAGPRIGFRIREGPLEARAVDFALQVRPVSRRIGILRHGPILTLQTRS
jgi:hypothetical protein